MASGASVASVKSKILPQLQAPQLIKRQLAVKELKKATKDPGFTKEILGEVEKEIGNILTDAKASWQAKHGAFLAAQGLLECKMLSELTRNKILALALSNLEHKEYRVRLVVASVLQALSEVDGIGVYLKAKKDVFASIHRNFTRDSSQAKIESQSKFLLPTANLLALAAEEEKGESPVNTTNTGEKKGDDAGVNGTVCDAGPSTGTTGTTGTIGTTSVGEVSTSDAFSALPTASVSTLEQGNTPEKNPAVKTRGAKHGLTGFQGRGLRRHVGGARAGGGMFQTPGVTLTPTATTTTTTTGVTGTTGTNTANAEEVMRPSTTTRVSKPQELTRWKAELREQMHDTEGWKSLETSFGALKAMISGAGPAFSSHVDGEVLELLERASVHTNRFVREIAYHTVAAIAQSCDIDTLEKLAKRTCTLLAKGLSDNWSQVRYASSIATRHLLTRAQKAGFADSYLPLLLPPMCINRYYVAQGVRIYSQESWRMAMGTRGPELVAKHLDSVVTFYVSQAQADNHAVREAACACITELALKVDKKAVSPKVDILLETLIDCFKDDSWPVRDAACSACGDFILAFPDESKPKMAKLYALWFEHLRDSIPTVREGAAIALGKAVEAYKEEAVKIMEAKLKETIPAVKEQKADSKRMSGFENVTEFGVARRITAKESIENSDKQMYSCGSLAPKMKKRGAGCMDHSFQRPAEPWEVTDGAVYLLREMSANNPDLVGSLMEEAVEMVEKRHYSHHVYLKQTFWKAIPVIAKNMGKRPFKRVMEPLMGPMCDTLLCQNKLAMHAAADCIEFLAKYLGQMIFVGRLDENMKAKIRRSGLISSLNLDAY